jgi:peptide/nickel transport system permease protein
MGLRNFIAKRLVYSAILIVLVILANYAIFKLMPGDPADFLMSAWSKEGAADRQAHEDVLRTMWGLNDPWYIQLFKYTRNLLTWNFGLEIAGRRPISTVMSQRIPFTLIILGISDLLAIVGGVILGIWVIQRRGSILDSTAVVSSLIVGSLPTFWIGLVFLWLFMSTLHWFPGSHAFPSEWAGGNTPVAYTTATTYLPNVLKIGFSISSEGTWALIGGYASHAVLPLMTLTLFSIGGWLLLTRATMLDTITEDYIVTARAKGLSESAVLYKHAFKNASLPIITSAAMAFGFVLSGAIITETVFSYPGIGGWIWEAIQYRDYSVLMAIFYVISLCVIVANIISDLLYGVIDPRIKYG